MISSALEHYNNDHGCYPSQTQWDSATCTGVPDFFRTYISIFPCDPETHTKYVYQSIDKSCNACNGSCGQCYGYRLLTTLDTKTDDQIRSLGCDPVLGCGYKTSDGQVPNYGIASGCGVTPVGFDLSGPIPTGRIIQIPTNAPSPTSPPVIPTSTPILPTATPVPPTPTPTPISAVFSNLSAVLDHDLATFTFSYSGPLISPYYVGYVHTCGYVLGCISIIWDRI